jgi:fructokinase
MEKSLKILAIGEVLWDMLPDGKQLGGAPANFIHYCNQLGVNADLISAVGQDELGQEILSKLSFDKSLISVNNRPSGQVEVLLENGIPSYHIKEDVAWDYLVMNQSALDIIPNCDVIYFGTLAQRSYVSRKTILELLSLIPENCIKVFDVNLRQNYYSKQLINQMLIHTDLLKLNEDELQTLTIPFHLIGNDTEKLEQLQRDYGLKWVVLTKGSKGSVLIGDSEIDYQPIVKTQVVDTIGAGDSFLASLVTGLLSGLSTKAAHSQACEISSFVCGQKGGMTPLNIKTQQQTKNQH